MENADPFRSFEEVATPSEERSQRRDEWTPIVPIPENIELTPAVLCQLTPSSFTLTATWRYGSAAGRTMHHVARFDRGSGGSKAAKTIRPICYCEHTSGRKDWRLKALPDDRPLFGLDLLAARPTAPVLVVEGEKTADAARLLFPEYVVTTSSGGSQAASLTDWTPLATRAVTIWSDADKPGRDYENQVVESLHEVGAASVATVVVSPEWPEGWDLADPFPEGLSQKLLQQLLESAPQRRPEACSWAHPDLSLLGPGRRAAPAFPLALLGEFWSGWVGRRAAAASAPPDYVAVALLACAGAALGNVRWPLAGAGWSEPPLLWTGLVGSPSSGKSPAMDAALALVLQAEEAMAAGYDEMRLDWETKLQTAKATREAWEADVKAAVKAGERPRAMPIEAEIGDMPPRPRIRIADATIEAMAKLASALPRGLLVVRDELSGWLGSFDRYGGGGADRAFALEMYGGRPYVVDRVKSANAIHIARLSIGLLGGVQPDKLALVLEGPDDGLAARLLWAWPDILPEFHLSREAMREGPAAVAFGRLTELQMQTNPGGSLEPIKLPLVREAEASLEEYARELVPRCQEASGIYAGALGKSRGHALRLSAIFEHLWWCARGGRPPETISTDAMLAAIALVDYYFLPMAERVFGDASTPVNERSATAVAKHLRRRRILAFNARELRREIGGVVRAASAMDAACAVLVEGGLIRPKATRTGDTPGRPARNYEVNPCLWETKP